MAEMIDSENGGFPIAPWINSVACTTFFSLSNETWIAHVLPKTFSTLLDDRKYTNADPVKAMPLLAEPDEAEGH